MPNDPSPLPAGARGTVEIVHEFRGEPGGESSAMRRRSTGGCGPWKQVRVRWDAPNQKRTLMLVIPPDQVRVIEEVT